MKEQNLRDGRTLNKLDVPPLEESLQNEPHNADLRLKLLAYYANNEPKSPKRLVHMLWMIENHPDSEIWINPELHLEEKEYSDTDWNKLINSWLFQSQKNPTNCRVMSNAAHFILFKNQDEAIKLLEQATKLDSQDISIPATLSNIYTHRLKEKQEIDPKLSAKLGLASALKALELQNINPENLRLCPRHFLLEEAIECAIHLSLFDKALALVGELKNLGYDDKAGDFSNKIESAKNNR